MIKTILVPTDFSPHADTALNFAVQIAKKAKAKIILVHACDLLELTFKDNLWLKEEYNRKLLREANEKLSLYCRSIREAEEVTIRKKIYNGLTTDTILHAMIANKADLVVMGTLGNSGIKEKILGSKTAGIIGRSTVPVLAIPLLAEWKSPENILFTIKSYYEGRKEIVQPLLELASLFKATITVAKFTGATSLAPYKKPATDRLGESYVRKLRSLLTGSAVQFVQLKGMDFEKRVESYMAQNHMDILAMITHRRNFVTSLFHRSMTKKMAYHSRVPLLAIPA